jgi:tetratricopeptide (TPR) repeat protein
MIHRIKRNALLIVVLLAVGCVRNKTVQDFGLTRSVTRTAPSPDASLRAIFRQQTQGAFNPLSGDPRIRTLATRLSNNPADIQARLELAAVFESYRFYEDALEHYSKAFDLNRSEGALLGILRSHQALNRAWRAIPLLEQFLEETPSAVVWNALGLLYDASQNLIAGENALREAVAANPLSDQWHNNLGYNLLLQNKTEAAESEFRKALELNSKSVTAHNNLGMLLARSGDLLGALDEFQYGADAATAHNNLAVVLMEMGKYEQSRDELVKALAMRRNFAPALSNFKLVQERMRERVEVQKLGRLPQSNVRVASAEPEASEVK